MTLQVSIREVLGAEGIWAEAWKPVAQALDAQANRCHEKGVAFPWTTRLGKGGETYGEPEVSLYRHVMDVLRLATELLYLRWQAGRLPGVRVDDRDRFRDVLTSAMAIALVHDANKYIGSGSHSPTLEEVRLVAEDVHMAEWIPGELWDGFTPGKLHAAVSRVEGRGLGMALAGEPLPALIDAVAKAVREGDNLVSRAPTPDEFVEAYNELIERWRQRYGVEAERRRLVKWRDEPPVLLQLQRIIHDRLSQMGSAPLVLWRDGSVLVAALPERLRPETILEEFRQYLRDALKPTVHVEPTTGRVTLSRVASLEDLEVGLQSAGWPAHLLVVKAADLPRLHDYALWWAREFHREGAGLEVTAQLRAGAKQGALLRSKGAEPSGAYKRSLFCAAILGEGGPKAVDAALDWDAGRLRKDFQDMQIDLGTLHPLSLRTVVALHAAAVLGDADLPAWVNEVHGALANQPDEAPEGVEELVDQLRAQVGIAPAGQESLPYGAEGGGSCLFCGAPASRLIERALGFMPSVKSSAFNTRIGHNEDLWRNRAENYICPACLLRQRLWALAAAELTGQPKGQPLLVATPMVSWIQGNPDALEPEGVPCFRQTSPAAGETWIRETPWRSSVRETLQLLWAEKPEDLRTVVRQMQSMAIYAVWSGEPVHAFVSGQRENVIDALLYEPLPPGVVRLLDRAGILSERQGVPRAKLTELLDLLDTFSAILEDQAEARGREAFAYLHEFGWWAAAWLWFPKIAGGDRNLGRLLGSLRGRFPMVEDEALRALAQEVARVQHLRRNMSNSEWFFVLRHVLDGLDAWHANGDDRVLSMALAGDLYDEMRRRDYIEGAVLRTGEGRGRCKAVVDAALTVVGSMTGSRDAGGALRQLTETQKRFLLAAYGQYLWEAYQERWASGAAGREDEEEEEMA